MVYSIYYSLNFDTFSLVPYSESFILFLLNCIHLPSNCQASVAMRDEDTNQDGFDYHRPVKMGLWNRHICWQRYISSFLKGASTVIAISFHGGDIRRRLNY